MFSLRTIYYVLLVFVTVRIFFFFFEIHDMFAYGFPVFWLLVFRLASMVLWTFALVMLASDMKEGYWLAGLMGIVSISEFLFGFTDYPLGIEVFIIVWLMHAVKKFKENNQ